MGGAMVRLYPTVAAKLLDKKARINGRPSDTLGRLWLLLHYLSQQNDTSGVVVEDSIRAILTDKSSPLRVGGDRYLRKLLATGDGVLWARSKGKIWLHGVKRVCLSIGVPFLSGRPVNVPLTMLCGRIADVRATFFAAFLGGRKNPRPISRQTLKNKVGICKRTQRKYSKKARIKTVGNTAVLCPYTPYALARAPQAKMGRPPRFDGDFVQVVGHFSGVDYAREAMGINWMRRDELKEAIPPVYTEFVGKQMLKMIE